MKLHHSSQRIKTHGLHCHELLMVRGEFGNGGHQIEMISLQLSSISIAFCDVGDQADDRRSLLNRHSTLPDFIGIIKRTHTRPSRIQLGYEQL
jgi:hypothetical protein